MPETTETMAEKGKVWTVTKVLQFPSDAAYQAAKEKGLIDKYLNGDIDDPNVKLVVVEGNCILNEGVNQGIWPLVCGASVTNYSQSNARIGVGNGTAAEDPSQTDLQGTSTCYKPCNPGYPVYGSNRTCTWQATFGESDANFAWNEWTISNTANINLNRKVAYIGTKNGGTWVLTVSLTIQ